MQEVRNTRWFDGKVRPAREGVYEVVTVGGTRGFKRFVSTGRKAGWQPVGVTPERAASVLPFFQVAPVRWRGCRGGASPR